MKFKIRAFEIESSVQCFGGCFIVNDVVGYLDTNFITWKSIFHIIREFIFSAQFIACFFICHMDPVRKFGRSEPQ